MIPQGESDTPHTIIALWGPKSGKDKAENTIQNMHNYAKDDYFKGNINKVILFLLKIW